MLVFAALLASASAWVSSPLLQGPRLSHQKIGRSGLSLRSPSKVGNVVMQQARNAAEALALLQKQQESKTRTAFDANFGAYTVKLKKPMGFIFEELSSKSKVSGLNARMDFPGHLVSHAVQAACNTHCDSLVLPRSQSVTTKAFFFRLPFLTKIWNKDPVSP